MKAIIMAGGEGKRLKPITGSTPKPLVPLCGRPVMEHIILLLRRHGITDICAALKYRPDDIKNYFGSGEKLGVRIDLSKLIAEHQRRSPAATIALCPEPEPLRYGLALCDREGFIRSFIEKPDWRHVVTNLVNTGIYIISPRAMEHVPENEEFDFAKDLFPRLLDEGEKLLGVPCDGYWCDIGTPKSYYECCADALSGKLKIELAGGRRARRMLGSRMQVHGARRLRLRRPRAAHGQHKRRFSGTRRRLLGRLQPKGRRLRAAHIAACRRRKAAHRGKCERYRDRT